MGITSQSGAALTPADAWVFTFVVAFHHFACHKSRRFVSWRERRFHAYGVFSGTKRNYDARGHLSVPVENSLYSTAGDPELAEEHGDHDSHEGELDARVFAQVYSSADRRFRKWEDVVGDSFHAPRRE